jgi:hypothetical protein
MADEKTQLTLDLLARNKMGGPTRESARDIERIGTAADAAGKKTEKLTKTSVIAGKAVDDLGDEAGQTERKMRKLDGEIKETEFRLGQLALGFIAAGSAAEKMDISKSIRKTQKDLRELSKVKVLTKFLPDPEPEAKGFLKKLGGALSGAGDSVATAAGAKYGIVIGGAIAAAASPIVVSAIGSALSAGVGAGFIGVGIALAVSKDKKIQEAGKAAGKRFVDGISASAVREFHGPIMSALAVLSEAGDRVAKRWEKAFKAVRGSVVPLTRDVVTAGERINDSLAGAAEKSGPALKGLGGTIILLGDAVGDLVDTLADGGPEAAANLQLIAGATKDALSISTNFLGVLGKLANNEWVTGPLLPLLRKHYQEQAEAARKAHDASEHLAEGYNTAELAARGNRDAIKALTDEIRGQTDPAFALRKAQDDLAAAQDKSAEAIKKHGANSKEAREATRNLATSALDLASAAGALGQTFDGKLTPSMRATYRAAGLTEAQIDAVEREFRAAKRAGDAYAKTYRAKVITEYINKYSNVVSSAAQDAYEETKRGMKKRASGGPVSRGTPYLVGENGPEVVVPNAAGRVMSAAASRGMARSGAQGSGGWPVGGITARVELVGAEEFRVFFRKMVRTMDLIPTTAGAVT